MPERIETTYADLRPTDLVIDKAGNAWPVGDWAKNHNIEGETVSVEFWLLDPVTRINMHYITKPGGDTMTVLRAPSQADEAAKLEAEFPGPDAEPLYDIDKGTWDKKCPCIYAEQVDPECQWHGRPENRMDQPDSFATMAEAVANVEAIGGEVVVEYTAEEYYAAEEANDDAPLRPPPFADMTPLEQRSHLYLLHGVIAYDLKSAEELKAMHAQAHAQQEAGTLQSAYIPHTHDGKF